MQVYLLSSIINIMSGSNFRQIIVHYKGQGFLNLGFLSYKAVIAYAKLAELSKSCPVELELWELKENDDTVPLAIAVRINHLSLSAKNLASFVTIQQTVCGMLPC